MKGVRVGQRIDSKATASQEALKVSVFATPLGYWAILGHDNVVHALTVGQPDARRAHAAFANPFHGRSVDQQPTDWYPELRQRLERYAAGDRVKFTDIKLQLPQLTQFQQQIVDVTRKLKYGETISYGELAARADRPRAARAVGTVMSSNRFPILIPCHRVIAAGGALGGYSAPQGLSLKTQLLELESQ